VEYLKFNNSKYFRHFRHSRHFLRFLFGKLNDQIYFYAAKSIFKFKWTLRPGVNSLESDLGGLAFTRSLPHFRNSKRYDFTTTFYLRNNRKRGLGPMVMLLSY
jgi:hypothetical protein